MSVILTGKGAGGTIAMHGSKSLSQRYILFSAFSGIPLLLHNRSFSDDEEIALGIARECGSEVAVDADSITVIPHFRCPDHLNVGESATSLRILLGLLTAKKCRTVIDMHSSLAARPHNDLLDTIREYGGRVGWTEDGLLSVDFSGITVLPYAISGSTSSQFVSSVIMMNALGSDQAEVKSSYVISSGGYIDLTKQVLADFGYEVVQDGENFTIRKTGNPARVEVHLEGDYSSASFLIVLGVLLSDQGIRIENLAPDSRQPDAAFVRMLESAGASITRVGNHIVVKRSRVGRVTIDVNQAPDLAPPGAVLGTFTRDGVTLRNCRRLEIKESDRLSSIITLASSMGANVERDGNDVTVSAAPGERGEPAQARDHRMVMSLAISSVISGKRIRIGNEDSVGKSYRNFFNDLESLGIRVEHLKDKDI